MATIFLNQNISAFRFNNILLEETRKNLANNPEMLTEKLKQTAKKLKYNVDIQTTNTNWILPVNNNDTIIVMAIEKENHKLINPSYSELIDTLKHARNQFLQIVTKTMSADNPEYYSDAYTELEDKFNTYQDASEGGLSVNIPDFN